ncbi:MAG: multicopper oxidase family protein [Candidatus Nomurabacteria bacterium]|nr:MAG: multicopper oxidase family protein [Candidatus Nomurabacteria bacterium]
MKYIVSIIVAAFIIGGAVMLSKQAPRELLYGVEEGRMELFDEHDVPLVQPTEVVELKDGDAFDLTASIVKQEVGNRVVKRLAYNGQIPGPVIKVEKGAKVTINFTNKIDMDTALHSHGLRGDWKMDGAVPITPPVAIGKSFSYELEFPDAGVYWYHPHVREDYQQELGLYGNFIVEEEQYWNQVAAEEYLIVDDILEDGRFYSDVITNTLMGRYGNKLLINDQADYELSVSAGNVTRLFITNVANTRTFDLAFPGAEVKKVGGDLGRIEHEELISHQIIAPAERYVLEVVYAEPGEYIIEHRGQLLGKVAVSESHEGVSDDFSVLRDNVDDYAAIRTNFASYLGAEPDKQLRLTMHMKGMGGGMMSGGMMSGGEGVVNLMGMEMTHEQAVEHCEMMPQMAGCEPYLSAEGHVSDGIEWEDTMQMMNNTSTDETLEWVIEDTATKLQNEKIDWQFRAGDMVKVRVYNDPESMHPMQHPLHFHGQRFVVLARDGAPNDNLQWKDTVLIPQGQTVDLLVDMSNPGNWMAHCHIAEHLHAGMMFQFKVE